MAVPVRLLRVLHGRLGREAADSLGDWMRQVEANQASATSLQASVTGLQVSVTGLHASVTSLRDDMKASTARLELRIAEMDAKIERRFADLLKWSFVFWVGAVASVAALAGILRR